MPDGQAGPGALKQVVCSILLENETVTRALKRLRPKPLKAGSKRKASSRQDARKDANAFLSQLNETTAKEEAEAKASFDRLTDAAAELMDMGFEDIYVQRREEIFDTIDDGLNKLRGTSKFVWHDDGACSPGQRSDSEHKRRYQGDSWQYGSGQAHQGPTMPEARKGEPMETPGGAARNLSAAAPGAKWASAYDGAAAEATQRGGPDNAQDSGLRVECAATGTPPAAAQPDVSAAPEGGHGTEHHPAASQGAEGASASVPAAPQHQQAQMQQPWPGPTSHSSWDPYYGYQQQWHNASWQPQQQTVPHPYQHGGYSYHHPPGSYQHHPQHPGHSYQHPLAPTAPYHQYPSQQQPYYNPSAPPVAPDGQALPPQQQQHHQAPPAHHQQQQQQHYHQQQYPHSHYQPPQPSHHQYPLPPQQQQP